MLDNRERIPPSASVYQLPLMLSRSNNGSISVSTQPLTILRPFRPPSLRQKRTQKRRTDANEASLRQGTATRVATCW